MSISRQSHTTTKRRFSLFLLSSCETIVFFVQIKKIMYICVFSPNPQEVGGGWDLYLWKGVT